MLYRAKVRCDGSHYVASFPSTRRLHAVSKHERTEKSKLFDEYFRDAVEKKIPKKKICEHIQDRFIKENDITLWLSLEEVQALYKNKLRNIHKRIERYKSKLFMIDWNYYVTFTYDDDKETADSFFKRLKKVFSNFNTRHGWKVIAVPEEGKETGRLHFHAFVHVPEGKMVGELFKNKLWSNKKRKWTYFTDNTYFNKRFGHSVWVPINRNDLRGGNLSSYLRKYLTKSGNLFFYSRGIPSEIDMMIDTDTDVCCTFYHYGVKAVLFDSLFFGQPELTDEDRKYIIRFDSSSALPGFDLNHCPRLR